MKVNFGVLQNKSNGIISSFFKSSRKSKETVIIEKKILPCLLMNTEEGKRAFKKIYL
jgi:hypothetical protein